MINNNKQLLAIITSVFTLSFSLSFGIIIKLQQETKLRKKKHNKLLYLAKNKLDCIEMLISNSIRDGIISHDENLSVKNERSGLLSSLGIRTPLSKVPGLNILFQYKK